MVKTRTAASLPDLAIRQINSLGGPPLPVGVPRSTLKVILENRAAAEAPFGTCRVALALATRSR